MALGRAYPQRDPSAGLSAAYIGGSAIPKPKPEPETYVFQNGDNFVFQDGTDYEFN